MEDNRDQIWQDMIHTGISWLNIPPLRMKGFEKQQPRKQVQPPLFDPPPVQAAFVKPIKIPISLAKQKYYTNPW